MEERTEQKRVMADTYMEEVWEQQAVDAQFRGTTECI